jgi:hypothetical protein
VTATTGKVFRTAKYVKLNAGVADQLILEPSSPYGRELRSIFQIKFEPTFFPARHRPTFK